MTLLSENETHNIIGVCIHVHKKLGCDFLEYVYQEALEKEFLMQTILHSRHKQLHILFDGKPLDKFFVADFVCYDIIILEIKAAFFLHQSNSDQVINYLKATGFVVGLLVNFRESSLKLKQFIHTPPKSVKSGLIRVIHHTYKK